MELKEAGYDDSTIESAYVAAGGSGSISAEPIPSPEGVSHAQVTLPGVGELLSRGVSYIKNRMDLLLLLILVSAFSNVLTSLIFNSSYGLSNETKMMAGLGSVAVAVVSIFSTYGVVYIVANKDERKVSIGESFSWVGKNIFSLLWIAILSAVLITGGLALFIVPGIILIFYIYFAQYIYVKEGKRGMMALLRSFDLVEGKWLSLASRSFLLFVIFIILSLVAGLALEILSVLAPVPLIVAEILAGFIEGLFALVIVVASVELYQTLVKAKPSTMPVNESRGWKLKVIMGIGIVCSLIVASNSIFEPGSKIKSAESTANTALLRMEMANVLTEAELYFAQNNQSYSGFCDQVSDIVSNGKKITCNDSDEAYAVSVDGGDNLWCSDSTGYSKSIPAPLGEKISCLEMVHMSPELEDSVTEEEAGEIVN